MPLPYENSRAGQNAMVEIQKLMQRFGCSNFGHMNDFEKGELIVQFTYKNIPICVRASAKGYAAAWLRQNPYGHRRRSTKQEHEKLALEKGATAVYSILRDWIKGQVMAIESGVLSFEGAFLGQMMLPSGKTVTEHVLTSHMLPQLEAP